MRGDELAETFREDERIRQKRIVFAMALHSGSAMIALGIAIAILGTPDRIWGILAAAIGALVWLQAFRRLVATS